MGETPQEVQPDPNGPNKALERPPTEVVNGEVIEAAERAATRVVQEVTEVLIRAESSSGPLPNPDNLAKYEAAIPGLGNRIVEMAEREQAHRHSINKQIADTEGKLGGRGLNYGLIVALGGFLVTTILGLAGKTVVASILGGGELVSLVAVFVVGRIRKPRATEHSHEAEAERPHKASELDASSPSSSPVETAPE